ncbi:MAG: hypothetical protein F2961_03490 [Actinobacteria bacterium]|nr:hypothetical protein [Actinomycetota bacterium]MTA57976.1 hypothetical protein [Actinomycetota bacterium]
MAKDLSQGLVTTLKSIYLLDTPIHHILVDGSEDVSMTQYMQLNFPQTQVLRLAPRGIYNAMNFGLLHVQKDDNVLFLNSNDFLLDANKLIELNLAASNSNSWAYGGVIAFSPQITPPLILGMSDFSRQSFKRGELLIPHPSTITPAKWIKELGGFREDWKISSDIDLAFRLFKRFGRPEFVPSLIAAHELGGISTSNSTRQMKELRLSRLRNFPFTTTLISARKFAGRYVKPNDAQTPLSEMSAEVKPHVRGCRRKLTYPYCCGNQLLIS